MANRQLLDVKFALFSEKYSVIRSYRLLVDAYAGHYSSVSSWLTASADCERSRACKSEAQRLRSYWRVMQTGDRVLSICPKFKTQSLANAVEINIQAKLHSQSIQVTEQIRQEL